MSDKSQASVTFDYKLLLFELWQASHEGLNLDRKLLGVRRHHGSSPRPLSQAAGLTPAPNGLEVPLAAPIFGNGSNSPDNTPSRSMRVHESALIVQ